MEVVFGQLHLQRLTGPRSQIGQGLGIGGRAVFVGTRRAGGLDRRELGFELLVQPGTLIILMSQGDQAFLDFGAKQGAKLFLRDFGVVAAGRPGGKTLAVVAGILVLRAVAQVFDQGDPRGQLGFLLGVDIACNCPNTADDLGPVEIGPARRIDDRGELVMDPVGERTASPIGQEKLPCGDEIDFRQRLDCLFVQEFLEVGVAKLEFVGCRSWRVSSSLCL